MVHNSPGTKSIGSHGIGDGIPEQMLGKDDLPPNLTPEGLSVDPNVKIYDAIIYLIYCPEHDKIAVTNVERARCVWFPFVCLNENQTWMQASKNGVDLIIGRKDAEMDAKEFAKQAPVYKISFLNILRIQLTSEKFITRLAMLVELRKSTTNFKCCQRSMRINWLRARDILKDRIDKVWGPELKNFTKILNEINETKIERKLITEFSLQNSFYHYFVEETSAEHKLLKSVNIKPEHIAEIYENFVEHCYPSFYMSFESFKHYLSKYGFDRHDPRLPFLFRACSLYNNDFLHFHEILLGIIAMEPNTKNLTEGRLNFIFRYYDTANNGYLKLEEFIVMVTDIYRITKNTNESINEEVLKKKIEEAIRCVGMKEEKIHKNNFIKAVLCKSFQNTELLCRSPKPILPQLSRLMGTIKEKSRSSSKNTFLINRPNKKGTCLRCRNQCYEYCLHCVTFDTIGRCVKPTIISEQWIEPVADNEMNEHKYSMEYVFNNSSVPNIFIDLVKDFYHKSNFEGSKLTGLMTAKEDWIIFSKYLTILCEDLKGLLSAEDKLIKINSPTVVIGDIQGNLMDIFSIEKIYFHSFPVIPHNLLFLGNYSGHCAYGVEVITYLFSMKLLAPNKIFLLRGTNEMIDKSKNILRKECITKYGNVYGKKIHSVIMEIFARLPIAIIIDESIFCCHSGIPKWNKIDAKMYSLSQDITNIMRDAPIAYDILVNTPLGMDECLCVKNQCSSKSNESKKSQTHRKLKVNSAVGVTGFTASNHCDYLNSFSFNNLAFNNFLRSNNLHFLIRSHSLANNENGFDVRFNQRCITIFSCSKLKHSRCTVAFVDGFNQRIRLISFDSEQNSGISVAKTGSVIPW